MAKRLLPVRLNESMLTSLDRFVEMWNKSGAPRTNRTLVVESAIDAYLKDWRPKIQPIRDFRGQKKAKKRASASDVVKFMPLPRAQYR